MFRFIFNKSFEIIISSFSQKDTILFKFIFFSSFNPVNNIFVSIIINIICQKSHASTSSRRRRIFFLLEINFTTSKIQ